MRTHLSIKQLARTLALAGALIVSGACLAQTEADARAENQRLQTEIDQLKKDLKASQDRVKLLEQQIIALQKARTAAATQPAAPEPEKVTIDESVPLASPRALRNHITTAYETEMGPQELGAASDSKRRAYMRSLHRWAASVNQKLKGPVDWHVRLAEGPVQSNKPTSLVAVDPVTDAQLGNAFSVTLPRASAERLMRMQDRGELGVLVLRGILNSDIRIDEARETRGPIDNPPFIGPFTEFVFHIDVKSLLPVKEDEKEQPAEKKENPKP